MNAQANLKRYSDLGSKGWATPQLVETQTAQVAQLQSAIKADEALIEAAQTQLTYTKLTSPIDGVVGIRQLDIGNIIHSTNPNGLLHGHHADEPISLIFTLPETNLSRLRQRRAEPRYHSCSPTPTIRSSWIRHMLGLVADRILQRRQLVQLKANFPNKRIASRQASSSTRGGCRNSA